MNNHIYLSICFNWSSTRCLPICFNSTWSGKVKAYLQHMVSETIKVLICI